MFIEHCTVDMRDLVRPQEQVAQTEISASSVYSAGYGLREGRLNERAGSWLSTACKSLHATSHVQKEYVIYTCFPQPAMHPDVEHI